MTFDPTHVGGHMFAPTQGPLCLIPMKICILWPIILG